MEYDSARVSIQETTGAEPGIEHETKMGSAVDDGDHDQVEEQLRLMFSEESPHEEGGINRREQSNDLDRLEVSKVADHNVGLGELADLNSIIDSSELISNNDNGEISTSKISVMGYDLKDKDEHQVVSPVRYAKFESIRY